MEQETTLREFGERKHVSAPTLKRWKATDPDFPVGKRYSQTCVRYNAAQLEQYLERRAARLAAVDQSAHMKALRAKRTENDEARKNRAAR